LFYTFRYSVKCVISLLFFRLTVRKGTSRCPDEIILLISVFSHQFFLFIVHYHKILLV
jgi:hypothetical protein